MPQRKRLVKRIVHHSRTWIPLVVLAAVVPPVVIVFILYFYAFTVPLPPDVELSNVTTVVDSQGASLGPLSQSSAQLISPDHLPQSLTHAVLAAEDHWFYSHDAIAWTNLITSFITNITTGSIVRGGSTITQQYVKNSLLPDDQRSLVWKFRETATSIKLENVLQQRLGSKLAAKNRILANYLNSIYFGHGVVGANAAAQYYFGRPAEQLTNTQAATLAGIIRAPSLYQNRTADLPAAASIAQALDLASRDTQRRYDMVIRRDDVLDAMARYGWLAANEDLGTLQLSKLALADKPAASDTQLSPCLLEKIRATAIHQLGPAVFNQPGLQIHITINRQIQTYAGSAAAAGRPSATAMVGLVALDSQTGAVRAMYDNCGTDQQYSIAVDAQRQIASTIKPVILAAGLKQGIYLPAYAFVAACVTRSSLTFCNDDNLPHTNLDAATALAQSNNPYFIMLATDKIGLASVVAEFEQLGASTGDIPSTATTACQPTPSLAVGDCERSVLAMASLYSTWANQGVHAEPYLIESITTARGTAYYHHKVVSRTVMPAAQAVKLTNLLTGVINRPDGTAHSFVQLGRPAAGKSGTSTNNMDAWFIGYTATPAPGSNRPSSALTTAVWTGYDDHSPIDTHGSLSAGSSVAAPIWQAFMSQAMAQEPAIQFTN